MAREARVGTVEPGVGVSRFAIAPRAVPFAAFIVLLGLDPLLGPLGQGVGLDPRWWYAARSVTAAGLLLWFWPSYRELHVPVPVRPGAWALAVAAGVAIFVAWIGLDFFPLSFDAGPGYNPRTARGDMLWALALTRFLGATLVVPVMEELFWRSFVMRWAQVRDFLRLDPRQVGTSALFLSSAVFALEHHQWFAGLLAGLAYGGLYRWTGSLRVAVVSHAVTNGLLGAWILRTGAWSLW